MIPLPAFVHGLVARCPSALRQFILFGMVGGIGFLVDTAVLYACIGWLGPYGGRVLSFLVAASTTWILNRLFTFRGHAPAPLHVQWAKFLAVSAGGFVFNYGAYAGLVATSPLVKVHPVLGVAAGSIAGMFFNFVMAKKVVFKSHP